MRETETVFREWMHLFREWMRLFRECMRLFHGSKSAHQLSVHVRWESKYTPRGTNNQSQQPYHRLFDLKKRPRLGQNVPWIQVEPARDCLWRHSTWWYLSVCKPASLGIFISLFTIRKFNGSNPDGSLSLGSLSERAICPGYGKTTSFDFILQIEMQTPWNRNGSFYLDIADLNVSLDTGCTPSVWYILDNLSATKASGSELAAIIANGEPPVA